MKKDYKNKINISTAEDIKHYMNELQKDENKSNY